MAVVEFLYVLTSVFLALYGLNSLCLVWLGRTRVSAHPEPPPLPELPRVTVQLPIYNEFHTVERLLTAVRELEYPPQLLEVQVLDDSTDQTTVLAERLVAIAREAGGNWIHLHRSYREGYKAGALAAGLSAASGEYIAIFDADFVPPSDFIRRALPSFGDPRVGCVQARWAHVNRNYSLLTRLQALGIDGHFGVEQVARSNHGFMLNFNGSAGIWRRTCIGDAGGWQADTLTEDLDLSYRAQLKGWRIEFLVDLEVPAELPAPMTAFKRQQARWAKGSLQTARKLMWPLMRSANNIESKVEAALHLTAYLVHPLILSMFLLAIPLSLSHSQILNWTPIFMIATLGPPLLYLTASVPEGPGLGERLRLIPGLVVLGMGLSLNNSRAALAGLMLPGRGSFERTPKFALRHADEAWEYSRYALMPDQSVWGEVILSAIAVLCIAIGAPGGYWGFVPWLMLYAISFGYVGGVTSWQALKQRLTRRDGLDYGSPPLCTSMPDASIFPFKDQR